MKISGKMTEIDKIDRKILSILQGDGRIANVELAERIGLSPTSVGERLKRLQRDGFVEGYGARRNPHRRHAGPCIDVITIAGARSSTIIFLKGSRRKRRVALLPVGSRGIGWGGRAGLCCMAAGTPMRDLARRPEPTSRKRGLEKGSTW